MVAELGANPQKGLQPVKLNRPTLANNNRKTHHAIFILRHYLHIPTFIIQLFELNLSKNIKPKHPHQYDKTADDQWFFNTYEPTIDSRGNVLL